MLTHAAADLRPCVFMVAVLDDIDVTPAKDGVLLDGAPPFLARWEHIATAVGDAPPTSDLARHRLAYWLRLARAVADLPVGGITQRLRPVGIPTGHVLHTVGWSHLTVMGGVLHLGVGLLGIGEDPDEVVVPPPGLLDALGIDVGAHWPRMRGYLEEMGSVAAARHRRDPRSALRPMGDCDVVTLLGSSVFRSTLAHGDGVGLRAAAVPMRRRGWVDPTHLDSAFARSAAAATEPLERGFDRPVLLTDDGVWEALDGDDLVRWALQDPSSERPVLRDVRYR